MQKCVDNAIHSIIGYKNQEVHTLYSVNFQFPFPHIPHVDFLQCRQIITVLFWQLLPAHFLRLPDG